MMKTKTVDSSLAVNFCRGGKTPSYALAALSLTVALGAAMPALAATRYEWNGTSDLYYTTSACWSKMDTKSNDRFFRSKPSSADKKTVKFNATTSISYKLSVESAGTSASAPYIFLADDDSKGLTSSGKLDVGTYNVGHLAIQCGTYKFSEVNVGGGSGTSGNVLVLGGSGNNATVTATGKVAINKETVQVKEKGKLICETWAAAGNSDNNTGTLVIDGGEVQHSTANYLTIGDTAKATGYVYVKNGGKYSNTGSNANGLCVGQKNVGTLDVDNGTVDLGTKNLVLCDNTSGKATVNVKNGGVVTMGCVAYGTGTGGATITIDGGTIKAAQSSTEFIPAIENLNVYIGDSGATFDTDGHVITIGENLKDVSGKTGSVRFIGGGVATLSAAGEYTGVTMVEVGTTVHVPSPAGIDGGLAVSVPAETPATGTYSLLVCDGEGVFTDAVLDGVATPTGATLSLSQGGKAVICTYGDGGPVWVGGTSGSLSDPSNWANNAVPGPGTNCIICVSGAATLTVGDAFAATSITFPADSAAVTINASGSESIVGIAAITNLSTTTSHTINVPVHFTGDIRVKQAAEHYENLANAHIVFAGGAYAGEGYAIENGATVNWSHCMFGKYYLANASDNRWTATQYSNCRLAVADDSTLYIPYAGSLTELYIGANAKAFVGDMDLDGRFLYQNYGEVTVTNMTVTGSADVYMSYNQGTATPGVFKIESMSNALSGRWFYLGDANAVGAHEFYIGAGGMNFTSDTASYCLGNSKGADNVCIIRPWYSDFAIADAGGEYNVVFAGTTTFCTDDEDGTGRTITIASATRAGKYANSIVVSGSGTLKVSKPCVNTIEPPVTVTGTATLEYAAGASLGTGPLSLGAGTTLALASGAEPVVVSSLTLPESGTATIRITGDAALADGDYAILFSTGGLPAGFESKINVVAPDGTSLTRRLYTSDNGTMRLFVGDGTLPCVWTGAADDGNKMNTPGNWLNGAVPPAGATVFIPPTAGTLDNNIEGFAPASVTFGYGDGMVTIGGNAIAGVVAITNNAPFHHVFNCPIVCADGVTPDITRGEDNYMTFAGGITMYDTPKTGGTVTDYWSGNVTLTTTSPVRYATNGDKNYGWLVSGTTFTFNNGKIDHMYIDAGATAVVERLEYNDTVRSSKSGSKTAYFNEVFDNGNGTIRTKEVKTTGTAVLFHSYADSDMVGGTIIAEKLTCATTVQTKGGFPYPVFMLNCGSVSGTAVTTGAYNGEGVWVIGPGGLAFGETIHARSHFETKIGKSLGGRPAATLHSYADWTLQASPNGRNTIALSIGSGNDGFIVIDTSHYAIGEAEYDSATSHTVTLDGQIVGGPMRVEGNGKVVFANEYNTFSGLTVTNTATASVKAGCKPGTGAVTVNTDATLEVAESGTATIDGALTLAEGAALAFNFTERAAAPVLAVATPATLPATVNVKVSAAGGLRPSAGQYTLTSGGAFTGANVSLAADAPKWVKRVSVNDDGNIVLDVKPMGTIIIFR